MSGWEWIAVLAGGSFTAAVVYFAIIRVPRWREMEFPAFVTDFARAINVADKVQPTLLAATIVSAVVLARSAEGASLILAITAIAGLSLTMIGSLAFMVPLQRRIIRLSGDPSVPLEEMRSTWLRGHLGRASLATVSFALLTLSLFAG